MAGLFGYTFLGASIFNVAEGIPLLPRQTLWVSFTMLSIQSVGLGYSQPAAGLMDRPPLTPGRPILTRALIVWLALAGLLVATAPWPRSARRTRPTGSPLPRPWAWSPSPCSCCSSPLSAKTSATRRSPSTPSPTRRFASRPARPSSCWSSTVPGIFQTVLKTVRLDVRQWPICTAVALSVVAAAEIREAVRRRTAAPPGMRVSR
jgi:P-type Ca2+ transporter type 2C